LNALQVLNACEAALWTMMALMTAFSPIRGLRPLLRVQFCLFFLLFAVSELIEIQTGAWWRPWGLAVWKGICILMLAGGFVRLHRNRQGESKG